MSAEIPHVDRLQPRGGEPSRRVWRFLAVEFATTPLVARNLACQDTHPMSTPLAIVLAAGKGTRMKSDLPKVMCQVNGRPMVHFVLDALEGAGVPRQIVVVGYRGDDVRQGVVKTPQR